jgi:tetratricopeptide (TPR) repeat protein
MDQQNAIRETSTARLGQRLRRARLARNLTQGEVAKNQFSVSYVSAVERGQIRPSLGALERLAERLQVPLTDLLGNTDFEARFSTGAGEGRESGTERFRDEIDARVRDAQILAQQGKAGDAVDTLSRLLSQQLSLRESVVVHWTLAISYIALGRGEDARREASETLPLAERLGDRELIERVRLELGNAHSLLHSHSLALDDYRACLNAVNQEVVRDPTFKLAVLYNIGNQHWHLEEYDQAVEYLRQATQAADSVVQPEQLGAVLWSLSLAYSTRGDTPSSKLYAIRSLGSFEEASNRRLVAQVYNRLGRAYAQSGHIADALEQLRTAHDIAAGQRDARGIGEAQRSLASVYLREQRLDEAAQAAEDALRQATEMGDPLQQAASLLVVARVREEQERYRDAEDSYTQALDLLKSGDAAEQLREAYAQYSEFLERRGENARAFEMLKHAYRSGGRSGSV